ncbi:DNA oxidative demethylase AlkB [Brucellaceae bacterium C25G]
MNFDLFADQPPPLPAVEYMAEGAVLLRRFAYDYEEQLLKALRQVVDASPFRQMVTPGGHQMSVAMTNCGKAGWVSDRTGYRYQPIDPMMQKPWPAMPKAFLTLAQQAAKQAGYADFTPDVCLMNRYLPASKLSLHQDKDEQDLHHPIVSVSLGLPAIFQFGGLSRQDKITKYPLHHGDVVVWGGKSRLYYHGILPLKEGEHPIFRRSRINLTFRKAL